MSDSPPQSYGLDPEESSPPSGESGTSPDTHPRAGKPIRTGSTPDPVPLEDEDETPMALRSVKEFDVCPNCGAAMRGKGEVVCLRCGFDLKTMKQVKVETGVVEVDEHRATASGIGDAAPLRRPITQPGMGDMRVPLIVAAAVAAILLLAYMAGFGGLFPPLVNERGEAIAGDHTITQRFLGAGKFIVATLMWTACGVGALAFVAHVNGLRLGEARLAWSRMLAIAAIMQLATLLSFSSNAVEWIIESIVQAAIFAGLALVLFGSFGTSARDGDRGGAADAGLKPKDAPLLVGSAIILFMLTWVSAWLVVWGTT